MPTPAVPAEWSTRLTAACARITDTTTRTDINAAFNTARTTLQGKLNSDTGDLGRVPHQHEQVNLDDILIQACERVVFIFRNIN